MTKHYPLWGRFGVTLSVTKDEAEKIINDADGEGARVLAKVFTEGRAMFDGESYIPEYVVEDFNRKNESNFEIGDVELNLYYMENMLVRPVQKKPPERGVER